MCYYLHYILVSLYTVCTNVVELVPSPDTVVMATIKQTSLSHDQSHDTVGLGVSLILSYIVLVTSVDVGWLGCEGGKTCTVDIVTAVPDESFCPLLLISNISTLYILVSRLVIQPVTISLH